MKKALLSVVAASSLLFTSISVDAKENITDVQASYVSTSWTSLEPVSNYSYETVEQVASNKATAKKGSFKMKHNTNVRADAGTKYKRIITAKKGATATATHQKKVGKQVWYKVKVNGKSGWVLSTLVTEIKAPAKKAVAKKKAPAKKAVAKVSAPKETKASGSFKTKHNSNLRSNAGTNHKIVTTAKKGATVKTTAQKKVGKTTWYKVSANGKTGWVSGDLLTKVTAKVKAPAKKAIAKKAPAKKPAVKKVSNSSASSKIISNAKALQGIKYKFGGTTKSGFDCSGFIQYAFKQSGKNIARDTLGQYAGTQKISNPQAGDLVFFAGTYRSGISHVGIYLGNNQFIHASTSQGVTINSVNDSYWKKFFHSYRR